MANILQILPELEGEEMLLVQGLLKELNDQQAQLFAGAYRGRRRDPMLVLVTTLLGFVVVSGIQRFLLGQIGMGLLYLFTGGLCLIGTIVDLVNYQKLAFEYNTKIAYQVVGLVKGSA